MNEKPFEHTSAMTFSVPGIEGQILFGADDEKTKEFYERVFKEHLGKALKEIESARTSVPKDLN